jgi:hypothetical protein
MHIKSKIIFVILLTAFLPVKSQAQSGKSEAIAYFERDVKPILRKRCATCHNAERPRGELDLTSYSGIVAGGVIGKVAVAGKPEESPVYTFPAHLEEPNMPPNAPQIPQRELDVLRRWIEGGLLESAGDSASAASEAAPGATAESLVTPVVPARPSAISALAVSPVSQIAAVSGDRQIIVLDVSARIILGALRFPEGDVFALRFSKDGQTLLAGGGIGAESGKVVLFDTKTWARASTVGDEMDAVLSADLSSDRALVVLGGPSRIVKVVANPKGQIVHTFRKPTDWVTATSFSPDGLLIAAGDRFGGLFLWETHSGKEFLKLKGHPKAVSAIAWNDAGKKLVTGSEDGGIQVVDLNSGRVTDRWEAHPGGVLWVEAHPSGRLASSGRDGQIEIWEPDGKLAGNLGPASDQITRFGWTADGGSLVSGDLSGEVRIWNLANSSSVIVPMPMGKKPVAVALVAPVLPPAQDVVRKPVENISKVKQPGGLALPGNDLEAILASAREAAASSERTVAALAKLARSRPARSALPSAPTALESAKAALVALQAAVAADPGNSSLKRALLETERAVKSLEQSASRLNAGSGSTK